MLKHPGRAAFLISKPLQLMIALCIVQQSEWDTKPAFVILDTFSGAGEVADRLLHEFDQFQSPVFFTYREAALNFLEKAKFDHLFIDSDVGVRSFLTLAAQKFSNPRLLIHVYEEGLGTYRNNLYVGFKKKLFNLTGVGASFGGCRFVNSVYVFSAQEYIDNIPENGVKVNEIKGNLSKFIASNRDTLKRLFEFSGVNSGAKNNSHCAIYLSNWSMDKEFISYFKLLKGDLFVKPHPHLRNCGEFDGVRAIGANVPAELVIGDLMEVYEFVRVFDNHSSVRRYVSGHNLTFELAQASTAKEYAAVEVESEI